jgi:wyosine [tRNA(Phe)-imidazoG37] synthetase (radical SAM superfamily)|tara:strand:+ start:201 stop:662 length:462 start_codon:yes stop_codon:yes gene_type:complete
MSRKQWMENAFWETEAKKEVNCILELEDDQGRITRQQMFLQRTDKDGTENELFNEVIDSLGEDAIDAETVDRVTRKSAEVEEEKMRDEEHQKARKLEKLFNYKMEAFEVEEIKNSKNRKLKAKLRRAKSKIEVDMYSIMILQDQLEAAADGKE